MADLEDRTREMCPICKTDKYLSPTMVFLINPECYHKICESCVDRIFAMGPTKCPYPNCNKILRKNRFKRQVFEDLQIEKETDIRRKVLEIYNKQEEDFEGDLQKYNEYLEQVENTIYKLTNDIDVELTWEQLHDYELMNKDSIKENKDRGTKEHQDFIARQNMEKQYKLTKLKLEKELKEEELKLQQLSNQEVLDQLSSSQLDTNEILQKTRSSLLKKTSMRRKQLRDLQEQQKLQLQNINVKQEEEEVTITPFTPFNGDSVTNEPFLYNETDYFDPIYIDMVSQDDTYRAGGYQLTHFFKRSLQELFIGLDCFIQDEKAV